MDETFWMMVGTVVAIGEAMREREHAVRPRRTADAVVPFLLVGWTDTRMVMRKGPKTKPAWRKPILRWPA